MKTSSIAILGGGNIGLALAKGIVSKKLYQPDQITLTRRRLQHLAEEKNEGYIVTDDNVQAIKQADVIILAVLPQQLNSLLDAIASEIQPDRHLLISVVSGVSCKVIREQLNKEVCVVRAMPNTAIAIGQSMTCISSDKANTEAIDYVTNLFRAVGKTQLINEELMTAATALCACGLAFFLRSIRAAAQGGTEIGFHTHEALEMAAQTALGAATLLMETGMHPESQIDKVTSPKGCTIAGLNEMEYHGFSSAMVKGIKLSAERAEGLYD